MKKEKTENVQCSCCGERLKEAEKKSGKCDDCMTAIDQKVKERIKNPNYWRKFNIAE
ncbi:MAG: hypothetical protein ACYCX4_06980 [Bacillota bacterium]